jgi:ABC-type branched-subunit amino acid transport system substrate-binding protein
MPNPRRATGLVVVAVVVGLSAFLATTATTSGASRGAAARKCAFNLRIGDVLPFTGDLAAYGANLDRAVKLAV